MGKGFDLRTHIRDPRTGKVIKKQPYTLKIVRGQQRYVRDGVEYHPDGTKIDPSAVPLPKKDPTETKLKDAALEEIERVRDLAKKEIANGLAELQIERKELAKERELLDEQRKSILERENNIESKDDVLHDIPTSGGEEVGGDEGTDSGEVAETTNEKREEESEKKESEEEKEDKEIKDNQGTDNEQPVHF